MKVIRRFNQHRRDLSIEMECEDCGTKETCHAAYDDQNFWVNVVPGFKCDECGKSSNDMGLKPKDTHTRYTSWEVI